MQIFPHIQTEKHETAKPKIQAKSSSSDMFSLLLGKITADGATKKSSENKTENALSVLFTKENFSRFAKQDISKNTAEKNAKSALSKNTAPIETDKTDKTKQEKNEKISFAASLYMQLLAELQVKTDKKSIQKTEIEQPKVSGIKLQTAILTELRNFLQESGFAKDEIKKLTDKLQADKNTLNGSFSVDFLREKITKVLLNTVQDFTQKENEATDIFSKQNQKLILPKIAFQTKNETEKKTADSNVKTDLQIDAKTAENAKIAPKVKTQAEINLQKIEQNEKAESVHNPAIQKMIAGKQEKTEKLLLQFESYSNRFFQSLGMSEKDSKKLSEEILNDMQEIRLFSEKQINESPKTVNFVKTNDKMVFEKKQKTDKSSKSAAETAQQTVKEEKTPKNDFISSNKTDKTKKEFNTEKNVNQIDKKINEKSPKNETISANNNPEAKKENIENMIESKTDSKTETITSRINSNEKQTVLDEKQIIRNEKQTMSSKKPAATEQKKSEIIVENQEKTETVKNSFFAAEFVKKQTNKKINDQDTKNRNTENKITQTEKAEIGEIVSTKMSGEEQNELSFKQENSSADHKSHWNSAETSSMTAKTSGKSEQFRLPNITHQIELAAFKNIRPGSQRLVLHLNPAELGSVMISLRVTQDKEVQAVLRAASPETAQIISEQMGQLRQMLENQGLKVSRLDVEHNSSFQTDLNFANRQNNPQSDSQKEFAEQFAGQLGKDTVRNTRATTNSNDTTNLERDLHNSLQKENFSSGVDIFA